MYNSGIYFVFELQIRLLCFNDTSNISVLIENNVYYSSNKLKFGLLQRIRHFITMWTLSTNFVLQQILMA
jgi:hypothetical protein